MPDLKQVLKDFVATSNSGKYPDEATLLSKFPELQGYDINALKDFVATANDGKYTTEDELFAKFPEFNLGGTQPISKKKDTTVLSSEGGSLASQKPKEEQGWFLNTVSGFDKGVLKNLIGEPAKGLGTLTQWATKKVLGGSGQGAISDALIKFGNAYNKTIDELTPQDEEYKNSLSDQFSQALGQVVGLIATGGAAKAVGTAGKAATALEMAEMASQAVPKAAGAVSTALKTAGAELSAPTSVSAGLAMGQSEFERAKEAGATDEQAFEAFIKNASVGSVLETIPVMGFLKRFEKASAGGISNYLKTKAVGGLVGGTEEMTTEVIQQLYSNGTAKDIYNTNQDLFEGVASSGGVGFGVGFLLNAMGANAKILRKEGKKAEADMVDKQVQEFEAQLKNGGPSSYKLNGLTLTPDVAIPLIEKMDGKDLATANLEIVNDPELKVKVQQKVVTSAVKEQVRQGNPELNEPSLNAITDLELELKKLEGNTTQTGKDKAAAIRQQIKGIQENPIKEEAVAATVEAIEAPEATQKRIDRISELEDTLSPESTVALEESERLKLQTELETLKKEQDAIQKQSTDEGVLRTGQSELGLQQVVEGNQGLEVATTGTEEVAPTKPQQEEVVSEVKKSPLEFSNELQEKYNVQLDLLGSPESDTLSLSKIIVPKEERKKGIGTKVINDIIEYANSNNKKITLTPSTDFGGSSTKRLTQFYKSLGFVENKGVNKDFTIKDTMYKIPEVSLKTQQIVQVQENIQPIEQPEIFKPITVKDVKTDAFTKDNALDYEEDERESDSGRMTPYLSSVTIEATNADGDAIGTITKITDEDKIFYFTVEDIDGNQLDLDGYDTLGDAKKALAESHNKIKEKEFAKESKKKAKVAEKVAEKQEEVSAEEKGAIDELMDLDVTDEDNLKKIFDMLDNLDENITKKLFGAANDAMLAIPLSTVQLVVKTLKALVKGGMVLRDAIKKVAADNNISQESVKDILNISPIQEGFNALMGKVDELIARQKKRGIEDAKIVSNLDTLIRKSDVYDNANDAQKKIMEREGRAKMNARERRAPSIGRILGAIKDITSASREEKLKIISQIRKLSKDASKELAKEIRDLAGMGKITANQAANIVARFGKVNMLSEISVSKFVDYMTKVFNDAEYAAKLGQANQLKKDISKLAKDKNKNANLRDLATQFNKIDPSMVDDIDAYNDMASKIKEAIKGSTIRGEKVTFAETVNIENASEYIDKTMKSQDEKIREEKVAEIQDLLGVDASDLSYDDLVQLIEGKEPITKYNEGIIRTAINKMFNIYSTLINESINTGKDPFTGEDVEYTKSQTEIIKKFMAMDLSALSPKEALQAVDALANFLQNQSTAKMGTILSEYKGKTKLKELIKKGIVAQTLKKYWSEKFGRFLAEQTTNLPVLFEKMFKGFNRGGEVEQAMGVRDLRNNKSIATKEANNIVDKYIEKFYDKKANGEAFNSESNSVERGLAAFMMRNVIGTAKQMQAEFNRRKNLIKESIEVLSQGNEQEQKKAELYQTSYDKILKDSESIQEVKDKTDNTNLEGIEFWNNEWANKYEQLSDVSENIYNKILDKDLNYTPDRFVNLSSETGSIDLKNDESAFHNNNGTIYKKETGVLMKAVKPDSLPKNEKSGDTSMYIDLSFDKNNANSMYDALVDMNTAAPIRQIESFLNSSDFKKLVPKAEDAKILKDRIQLYVGNIRNKNPYSNDELSATVRNLNKIASIGVGQALGGILQPIKQVLPVAMNTLVNAGNLDFGAAFDSAKNNFINKIGYGISNRGIESQAQIESLNKLIDEASKSKGEQLVKNIEKLNKWWLEKFLVNPDVFIARSSWMTYYEQSLKKQGIDPKGIDYNTHEVNEEAANYAERMVDRQQNVSDADLAGKMFSNKESSNQLLIKTLMPFASFRMNQSARLGADLAVLSDKTATQEDKKIAIRSISGFAAEMAMFKIISAGSIILLGTLTKKLMDDDENEEDYEKRVNNVIKGQLTSTFNDVVSPLPILDKAVQAGGNFLTESVLGIPKESVFSIYGVPKQDYISNLGLFGITADRASQLYELTKLSITGEYTDNFGKKKEISEDKKDGLKFLIGPAILSNVGLAPVEVNTVVRNAIKDSKKKKKTYEEILKEQDKRETEDQKIEVLEKLKRKATSKGELDAIENKIDELEYTPEQKKMMKLEDKIEKADKDELLTDPKTGKKYDNESELKRYNPRLYQKNFGVNSEWYKEHKAEKKVQEKLSKEMRKLEDIENKYRASPKKRNADGSFKRNR